ncbi:hypothetical protein ACFE04_018313 [Oxalis oulophora]
MKKITTTSYADTPLLSRVGNNELDYGGGRPGVHKTSTQYEASKDKETSKRVVKENVMSTTPRAFEKQKQHEEKENKSSKRAKKNNHVKVPTPPGVFEKPKENKKETFKHGDKKILKATTPPAVMKNRNNMKRR